MRNANAHNRTSSRLTFVDNDFTAQAQARREALGVSDVPFYEKKDYGGGARGLLRRVFRRPPVAVERHYMNSTNQHMEVMERSDGKSGNLISQRVFTSETPAGGTVNKREPAADLGFQIREARGNDEFFIKRAQRARV
jgi:hypothetical protein